MEISEDTHSPGELKPGHDIERWAVDSNHNIRTFTEDEIKRITRNYSTLIGKGGFGEVYKGILGDDCDLVAVKRYIRKELREEFMEEVSIHRKMSHKNVVKLIGYCIGESTLTMVTEYISKGNLDDILHDSAISIPLDMRLGIAIGCAEALCYMHSMHLSSDDSLVCHGDIKPANILLDENLTAKVSDFGLARLLLGGISQYTSNVKGSIDYMDPIHLREGRLTPKSDVYSFGAVLLEIIARKRIKQGNCSLISTFSNACSKGASMKKLIDAEIASKANMKILEEIGKLATECLTLDIHKRPRISDVAKRLLVLWKALQGGQEKGELLVRTQNVGTSSFNCTSSLGHRRNRSLGVFETDVVDPDILIKLGNMRFFTVGELNEITKNFTNLVREDWLGEVYKGTLEDNTLVAVKKSLQLHEVHRYYFINEAMIHAQLSHHNIIKLFGFCLEVEVPIFVYEYVANGTLSDLLNGTKCFPLELRLQIAIRTAKALTYMHSSDSGCIRHGSINPSNILLDDNFMPKVSGFPLSRRLTKDYDYAGSVVVYRNYSDPKLCTNRASYSEK
jgi:serine/threonine protein kinase